MVRRKSPNEEFWPDIIRRVRQGETQSTIAESYGLTPSAIIRYMERHSIQLEDPVISEPEQPIVGRPRRNKRQYKIVRRIDLRSGGYLQLLCVTNHDLLALSQEDRTFVTDMFDLLTGYSPPRK